MGRGRIIFPGKIKLQFYSSAWFEYFKSLASYYILISDLSIYIKEVYEFEERGEIP
jgi:hypothetical protein